MIIMDAIKWDMSVANLAAGAIVGAVAGHFTLDSKGMQRGAMIGAITVFFMPTAKGLTKGLTKS